MSTSAVGTNRTRLLGWIVAGVLGFGFAWLGAVEAGVRVGLHLGVVLGALVATRLPRRNLARAGERVQLVAALGWLFAMAIGAGLVPLGSSLMAWVAPGIAAARPADDWWTAALSPEGVLQALAFTALATAVAAVAAVWSAQQDDTEALASVVLGAGALVVALGLGHLVAGTDSAFGVIAPADSVSGPFFGPLVNTNHVGSVLLLAFPLALRRALDRGRSAPLAVGLAVGIPLVLVGTSAGGAATVAVAVVIFEGARRGRYGAAAVAAALLAAGAIAARPEVDRVDTLAGRATIWADASRAWMEHPVFGVGAGGFLDAVEPYRTDGWRATIAHAHNDALEWFVETGLVGLAAVAVAVVLLWRWRPALEGSGEPVAIGLLAVCIHSLVDFPFAIPAIALAWVALAGALSARARPSPGAGARARTVLYALALLNLLGAAAAWQASVADEAEAAIRRWESHPERAAKGARDLAWWGPWRGWDRLHGAWMALEEGDAAKAVTEVDAVVALGADDDDLLRPAALVLARAGRLDAALDIAERARARGDVDYRNHVAMGRILAARGDGLAAAEAYLLAFRRDAPDRFVREAYEAMPVAVYWIDALEDLPHHSTVLGVVLTSRGDPEEALLAFEQAERVDPNRPSHPVHALAIARTGRVDEGVERARAAAATGEPEAIRVLGEALHLAGDPAGAISAWESVERDFPAVRASIVRELGVSEGVQAGLDRAERYRLAGWSNPWVLLEVARLHARAGDPVACRGAAEQLEGELRRRADQACGAPTAAEGLDDVP